MRFDYNKTLFNLLRFVRSPYPNYFIKTRDGVEQVVKEDEPEDELDYKN